LLFAHDRVWSRRELPDFATKTADQGIRCKIGHESRLHKSAGRSDREEALEFEEYPWTLIWSPAKPALPNPVVLPQIPSPQLLVDFNKAVGVLQEFLPQYGTTETKDSWQNVAIMFEPGGKLAFTC
jgi:hypothetical protein